MRTGHLNHIGAQCGELLDGRVERRHHTRLVPVATQLSDHTDADTLEVSRGTGASRGHDIGYRFVDGRGVARIVARDHLVQERGVQNRARARTALIQR
ncbi:Uncharacterised protein [Mycobacteroides abscessus subsp. abscessus]|nr:Uncharacterised protein [Mycobacteroides abscessus subsp. abscessus]SIM10831.1 Uncharacterised protein [Mycobacteroides abscessus subsp. abscessus]SKV00744.1 Uncharacterised protein [Mycobacteroides abscessus subsp. abscessus]